MHIPLTLTTEPSSLQKEQCLSYTHIYTHTNSLSLQGSEF